MRVSGGKGGKEKRGLGQRGEQRNSAISQTAARDRDSSGCDNECKRLETLEEFDGSRVQFIWHSGHLVLLNDAFAVLCFNPTLGTVVNSRFKKSNEKKTKQKDGSHVYRFILCSTRPSPFTLFFILITVTVREPCVATPGQGGWKVTKACKGNREIRALIKSSLNGLTVLTEMLTANSVSFNAGYGTIVLEQIIRQQCLLVLWFISIQSCTINCLFWIIIILLLQSEQKCECTYRVI